MCEIRPSAICLRVSVIISRKQKNEMIKLYSQRLLLKVKTHLMVQYFSVTKYMTERAPSSTHNFSFPFYIFLSFSNYFLYFQFKCCPDFCLYFFKVTISSNISLVRWGCSTTQSSNSTSPHLHSSRLGYQPQKDQRPPLSLMPHKAILCDRYRWSHGSMYKLWLVVWSFGALKGQVGFNWSSYGVTNLSLPSSVLPLIPPLHVLSLAWWLICASLSVMVRLDQRLSADI